MLEEQQIDNDEEYQHMQDDAFQLREDLEQAKLELKEEKNVSKSFGDKISNLTAYIQKMNRNVSLAA